MVKFSGAVDKMNRMLWSIAAVLLLLISMAVAYDVISRYFFNRSHEWVGEYSGYMLVCISFLTAPFAMSIGGMTKIDLLQTKVKNKTKRLLIVVSYVATIGYLSLLCYESSTLAYASYSRGWMSPTEMRTPLWIPQITIPIGTLLMILTTVLLLVREIVTPLEPDRPRVKLSDEEMAKRVLAEATETVIVSEQKEAGK